MRLGLGRRLCCCHSVCYTRRFSSATYTGSGFSQGADNCGECGVFNGTHTLLPRDYNPSFGHVVPPDRCVLQYWDGPKHDAPIDYGTEHCAWRSVRMSVSKRPDDIGDTNFSYINPDDNLEYDYLIWAYTSVGSWGPDGAGYGYWTNTAPTAGNVYVLDKVFDDNPGGFNNRCVWPDQINIELHA